MWCVVVFCCSCWMWRGKVGENGCSVLADRRPPVWEVAVRLAVAVGVFNSVLFCDVFFPTGCLG